MRHQSFALATFPEEEAPAQGERHGRYVHGLYTAEAIEERRTIMRLLRSILR